MSASVTRFVTKPDDPSRDLSRAVSADLLADKAGKAWLAVHQPGSITRGWDSGDVDWALERAHRLIRRLGGRVGPKDVTGYWPSTIKEVDEYVTEGAPRRVASAEVSIMNAALSWVWDYLAGRSGQYLEERWNERIALARWCFCKETGTPYAKLLRELGAVKATADKHRRRGSLYIAAGLCADDVRIPRDVLLARFERARSDMADVPEDDLATSARQERDAEPPDPVPYRAPELVTGWPIAEFWNDLGRFSSADAMLAMIVDRVRSEAGGADLATLDMTLLTKRHHQLVAEATKRGLLPASARRAHTLSTDELTARIERLRGNA